VAFRATSGESPRRRLSGKIIIALRMDRPLAVVE
jgi:hypothetical protein